MPDKVKCWGCKTLLNPDAPLGHPKHIYMKLVKIKPSGPYGMIKSLDLALCKTCFDKAGE